MDKAIIFGVFNFVSFHICKTLLNKGVEVNGVHIEEREKDPYLEEKRLEVGRNANFVEQSLSEWKSKAEEESKETSIIFSLYDLYMLKKENILQKESTLHPIIEYINSKKSNVTITFLVPIQMLMKPLSSEAEKELERFIASVRGELINTQLIYLPAVYGQWQPPTFLFQQVITSKYNRRELTIEEREWKEDALYIGDTVEEIMELIESDKDGCFLIESGKKNQWLKCAAYLNIDDKIVQNITHKPFQINLYITRTTLKNVTPIAESLMEQQKHVQNLYELE